MICVCKLVNLIPGYAQGQHDLELVFCLHCLCRTFALAARELCKVFLLHPLNRSRWYTVLDWFRRRWILVALEILAKHRHLVGKFVCARFDRHPSAVESQRKQCSLAQHACKTCRKLDLACREAVTCMKSAIHVGVCHC